MRPHQTFAVVPHLPPSLEPLRSLAWNLRFSWDPATLELFRMLDPATWEKSGKNPVAFLGKISQARLEQCAADDAILANLERVTNDFTAYVKSESTWYDKVRNDKSARRIAYFSAEFGLSNCLPLYSGGLGVLAGDHLKSASDLGIPLVGVGLLYRRGYFQQYLNSDGWQQESYPTNDFHNLPLKPVRDEQDQEVFVELPLDGTTLHVKLWTADVGRVTLVLLDTDVMKNRATHRTITSDLYGGDSDTRLLQEYVLGVGGVRALQRMGLDPDVCHMNEGHSAFLALERMRVAIERDGLSFAEAQLAVKSSSIFTTHTPVHAAIDLFSAEQMERVFSEWRKVFSLDVQGFMDLGREAVGDHEAPFNMAVFAFRTADLANGVSKLHGQVSRNMWKDLWPGVPEDEVPIDSVTNGIHSQTWISRETRELFDRYLGPRWARDTSDESVWAGIDKIPSEVLWRNHDVQRQRLVAYVRQRLRSQAEAANRTAVEVAAAGEALDPGALTIGFARRFAPYKRGNLILRDPERLKAILTNPRCPVQIVYAGKAHPRDDAGKKLIQEIVHFSRDPEVRGRIVFLENYGMEVASHLVHGVDVWLNNPRRPLEASGTSGMKASANGALNFSILDGWWDEAAGDHIGWSIGAGESYEDTDVQDEVESSALYDLLEHEIVPLFYDRGRDGLPRGWARMMKSAMKGICPVFNTNRMVGEYAERFYFPAVDRSERLKKDNSQAIRDLSAWLERVKESWPGVRVHEIGSEDVGERSVGDFVSVEAKVELGGLHAEDLLVQLVHGEVSPEGAIVEAEAIDMNAGRDAGDGCWWFSGKIPCERTGHRGYTVRVLPRHPELSSPFGPGLVRWAHEPASEHFAAPLLA